MRLSVAEVKAFTIPASGRNGKEGSKVLFLCLEVKACELHVHFRDKVC